MNQSIHELEIKCQKALERIDQGIKNHENDIPEDMSIPMLLQIKIEIEEMRDGLHKKNPLKIIPGYSRFVLDWEDKHGLCDELVELSYCYKQFQKQYIIYQRKLAEQEEKDS